MPTTRFYLGWLDGAPSGLTPAFDASWELTSSAVRKRTTTTKRNSVMTTLGIAESSATSPYDVLLAQFISEPIAAQTVAGNVKGIIRALESNALADDRAQLLIKVVDKTGATVRGTLLAHDASALASEFDAATLTNRKFPLAWSGSGAALSSVVAQQNDRIVIEIGYRAHNSSATSYTGSLRFGDVAASDCAEDETSTDDYNPWIEFDSSITFATPQTDIRKAKENYWDLLGQQGGKQTTNTGSYGAKDAPRAVADLASKTVGLGTDPNHRSLPSSTGVQTVTDHYLMRWLDVDCGPVTYRTWHVTGNPDPTGTGYSGTKCGATPISGAVVAAFWQTS